jgi:hypothetical protein
MWNLYKDQPLKVACRLAAGDVCAKYTYFYNGAGKVLKDFFFN